MKLKNSILYTVACIFFLLSCNDFLEDVQPETQLPISEFYQSYNDLETALAGVYNSLQSTPLAGGNLWIIPEYMSENREDVGTGDPDLGDLNRRLLSSTNFYSSDTWKAAYRTINLSNAVLEALPKVVDATLTPQERNRIEGEAKMIRGYLYFELLRFYGQPANSTDPDGGVPLILTPVLSSEAITYPKRESIQAVADQIRSDLEKAFAFLPEGQPVDRANAAAAKALLARLAFWEGNYAETSGILENLLADSLFALAPAPMEAFRDENSMEILFSVAFSAQDPNLSKIFFFGFPGANKAYISDDQKAAFKAVVPQHQLDRVSDLNLMVQDLRYKGGYSVSEDSLYTQKYEDPGGADDTPVARLAEFVLMQAECLARLDKLTEAVDLLNQIRARSLQVVDANGNMVPNQQDLVLYKASDFAGKEDLIEAIVLERRIEMCYEGNFFHDQIRLKREIQGTPHDDCRLRLPIPQREMDVNPNLKQNQPCY